MEYLLFFLSPHEFTQVTNIEKLSQSSYPVRFLRENIFKNQLFVVLVIFSDLF